MYFKKQVKRIFDIERTLGECQVTAVEVASSVKKIMQKKINTGRRKKPKFNTWLDKVNSTYVNLVFQFFGSETLQTPKSSTSRSYKGNTLKWGY